MLRPWEVPIQFSAGLGKSEIDCFIPGVGMMGYGQARNTVKEQATPLHARCLRLLDETGAELWFINVEICFVTLALKDELLHLLQEQHPEWEVTHANLVLTAQHTHSAPGGYSHYPLYNFMVPGFRPRLVRNIAEACLIAMTKARVTTAPAVLKIAEHSIDPNVEVAFNRSTRAHLRNSDRLVENLGETAKAVDRRMHGLQVLDEAGGVRGFISWFGVHATSISSFNQRIHYDNKGVAARRFEEANPGSVAIFAQSSAGDVSPNFIWDKKLGRMRGKYSDQYENAEHNGELQFTASQKLSFQGTLGGTIAAVHAFFDLSLLAAPAAHGLSFFTGTLEGPGMPAVLARSLRPIIRLVRSFKLRRTPEEHTEFYQKQFPKDIVLDHRRGEFLGIPLEVWKKLPLIPDPSVMAFQMAARKDSIDTLPWVPHILPMQLVRLGSLALACVPGEITTVAGRRLEQFLLTDLRPLGIEKVIVSSYANAYMGYVTTPEEYDEQCYEGGHTVYGRNTFTAFHGAFMALAQGLRGDTPEVSTTEPFRFPTHELARRTEDL